MDLAELVQIRGLEAEREAHPGKRLEGVQGLLQLAPLTHGPGQADDHIGSVAEQALGIGELRQGQLVLAPLEIEAPEGKKHLAGDLVAVGRALGQPPRLREVVLGLVDLRRLVGAHAQAQVQLGAVHLRRRLPQQSS